MEDREPVYRIPPDWTAQFVAVGLSEVLDWSLEFLHIPDLWKTTRGAVNGKPLVCCVLDTGVDDKHPDLQGAILDAADFTNSMSGHQDRVGHGTWCASMIAARYGNNIGIGGIANECQVLVAKVLGDNGSGSDNTIGAGLDWGFKKGADFFSLSLGGPQMSKRLFNLFNEVASSGKFIFCASGNDGGAVNFPANWPCTCAVGAVDKQGNLTDFSSRGPELDILAPGTDMLGAVPGGYAKMSGTSMATPVACGIGILAYAKDLADGKREINNLDDMIERLKRTSVPRGQFGLIDPGKLLADLDPLPPAPVVPPGKPIDEIKLGPVKMHIPALATDFASFNLNFPAKVGDAVGISL